MAKKVKRLFEQFQPENYQLAIEVNPKSLTFKGTVVVKGKKTGPPSSRLTFHQKDLNVTNANVTRHDKAGDKELKVDRINLHKGLYEVRLHTAETAYAGSYTISIDFSGKITKTMLGIYPSYFEYKGKRETIIVTQFEAHHAREAFPCIDEPEAKATFDLTVISPKDNEVVSNTPLKKRSVIREQQSCTFETTPLMSVYLLAFATGKLHYFETKSKSGVAIRTWSGIHTPIMNLEYATREAANVLDFFTNYFKTPYPLKKLDQIALPDYDVGAMENWGMVTYREVLLNSDPANPSISGQQLGTLVIAHELSHQWFGNLVTMKWWNDLWLNESFAGLMEHVAPDALHPDWNQWELYAISDIALITSRDVYKDIQPVSVDVNDPDLIETLFDPAIVYAKGARLLKMLREYIGEEAFVRGLHDYFKDHAYRNATRHDLWVSLAKASHKDIDSFMTPWLTQPGMPVVHVTQDGKKLHLKQERFLLDGEADGTLWPIPLLADEKVKKDLFENRETTVELPVKDYVLINQNASGQYITHYTKHEHRMHLAEELASLKMNTAARINLLNDMFMLARRGDASLTDSLEVVMECENEPRDSVWGIMLRAIGAAGQLTEGDDQAEEQLKKVRSGLSRSLYDKLGWHDKPKDDANTKQLRHTVISCMVGSEDSKAVAAALDYFKKHQDLAGVPAEIRNTILGAAVRFGDGKAVNKLLELYPKSTSEMQSDISSGLAATKDPKVAQRVLDAALGNDGFVRDQDILRFLILFLRNHHTRGVTWNFMVKKWDWLESSLGESKTFDYLPTYCASVINTKEWKKKYTDLFNSKMHIKALANNIKLGIADIDSRIAWRKRDEAKIKAWLKDATSPGSQ